MQMDNATPKGPQSYYYKLARMFLASDPDHNGSDDSKSPNSSNVPKPPTNLRKPRKLLESSLRTDTGKGEMESSKCQTNIVKLSFASGLGSLCPAFILVLRRKLTREWARIGVRWRS